MSRRVAIIGGGIGGLALANLLAKSGHEVTVYEKGAQLGGRAGRKEQDGFTFDTGPSWYLMPKVFTDYFARFDIDVQKALDIQRLSPAYKVFFDTHSPVTIQGDARADEQTFEAIESGAGESLKQYIATGDRIYQMALKHFLYTDFSQPLSLMKREIALGSRELLTLLRRPLHAHVSRYVQSPELQQILEYPMVFLGTSPFHAPAMYSLMSALDFKEGVYYPARGMYSIIELLVQLGRDLAVTYKPEHEVIRIINKGSKATGILLANGTTELFDVVVSNADLHFTETQLLAPDAQSYPEVYWTRKQPGISGILMYLGVKGALPQLEHHNLYFVKEWEENFDAIYSHRRNPENASMYVSRTTATDSSTAPTGHENLFVLVPIPAGIELDEKALETAARHYLERLAIAIDAPDLPQRIVSQSLFGPDEFREHFHSWEGSALGMSHVLKQSAFWRIRPSSKKLRNLYYVGANTLPGIGLPMCLISAEIVAKKINARTKKKAKRT